MAWKILWPTTYRWQYLTFSRACSFFLQLVGLWLPLMGRRIMQGVRESHYHLPSARNQRFPFHWMTFNSGYQLFRYKLARCLYIIASALYIALLIFFSVQKCSKKINVSANRVQQKYCRIPFAIPASETMVKLKEITCTCGMMNIEKNRRRYRKWVSREAWNQKQNRKREAEDKCSGGG